MKIIRLISRNIKNLKAVEITPDGNIVTLSGKNGAGKSAILDSIFSALTGTRLKDPIRHGQEKADVTVDMGAFTVRKRWTEKSETIQVYSVDADGKKKTFSSPQTFLDQVIGELSFDPLEFQKMKPADQVELLKKIVGLDFKDLDEESEKVYADRTTLNIRIKDAVAHLKNETAPDPETPDEEISYTEELRKIEALRAKERTYRAADREFCELKDALQRDLAKADDIRREIAALQDYLASFERSAKDRSDKISAYKLPESVPQDAILAAEAAIQDIEQKNAAIRQAKRYRESIRQADKLRGESDKLTERLRRIDQDKQTRVAAAAFPIPGLALADDGVMYEKQRFDRLSTGQQIKVSTAIGMAINPQLKVVFIREGSLLDSEGLAAIAEMAKDKDYQVWVEACEERDKDGNPPPMGIFIEAGEITAIDGRKAVSAGVANAAEEEDGDE